MKKNELKPLYFFVLGIAFFEIFLPFLSSFFEIFSTFFERLKAPNLLSVSKVNKQIQELNGEEIQSDTRAIGFEIPSEEEEEYEEEEE